MQDRFDGWASSLEAPASHGFAITPSDGTDLAETTRAVFIGGAGTLTAILASGAELVFTGLQAGTVMPLRVRRIKATGTTATTLIGLV